MARPIEPAERAAEFVVFPIGFAPIVVAPQSGGARALCDAIENQWLPPVSGLSEFHDQHSWGSARCAAPQERKHTTTQARGASDSADNATRLKSNDCRPFHGLSDFHDPHSWGCAPAALHPRLYATARIRGLGYCAYNATRLKSNSCRPFHGLSEFHDPHSWGSARCAAPQERKHTTTQARGASDSAYNATKLKTNDCRPFPGFRNFTISYPGVPRAALHPRNANTPLPLHKLAERATARTMQRD